jgi:hypothetical protein
MSFGKSRAKHDLSLVASGLRSHGGRHEQIIPIVVSHPLSPRYAAEEDEAVGSSPETSKKSVNSSRPQHRLMQRQSRILQARLQDHPHRTLPQLLRVLPTRCHDQNLSWT